MRASLTLKRLSADPQRNLSSMKEATPNLGMFTDNVKQKDDKCDLYHSQWIMNEQSPLHFNRTLDRSSLENSRGRRRPQSGAASARDRVPSHPDRRTGM